MIKSKSHDSANLNLEVRNSPNLKEKKIRITFDESEDQTSSRISRQIQISSEFEFQNEFNAEFDKKIETKSSAVAKVQASHDSAKNRNRSRVLGDRSGDLYLFPYTRRADWSSILVRSRDQQLYFRPLPFYTYSIFIRRND